jgi:RNA polymerase sigma factor for flagellar operon FliA
VSGADPEGLREARIRELFPIVRQIARRIARVARTPDIDDLVGDGCIGLIRAVDLYDPERGTALDLYARRLIVGAMLNGLRRRDPVSERVRRTIRRAEERRYELAQELGTLPPLASLERDDPALSRARAAAFAQTELSLEGTFPAGADPLIDDRAEPARCAVQRDRMRRLHEAIALLPDRERRVVALHYGAEQSLRAIGRALDVSPQRASQLHLSALARLRQTAPRS